MARIFKTRYYPTTSFLQVKIKPNPSLIWRSILSAQGEIQSGVRWRIGSGEHVKIWQEPWVPNLRNQWLQSPPAGGLEEATMNSLKNNTGTGWDDDILLDHYNMRDQALIKQVPVSLNQPQDQWKWVHDLKGFYTVKCGHYHLSSTQLNFPFNIECASLRKLWSFPIPPKAKNPVWRVYMGLLPTMKSLVEKRVVENSSCPSYHDGMEDLFTPSHLPSCSNFPKHWSQRPRAIWNNHICGMVVQARFHFHLGPTTMVHKDVLVVMEW